MESWKTCVILSCFRTENRYALFLETLNANKDSGSVGEASARD